MADEQAPFDLYLVTGVPAWVDALVEVVRGAMTPLGFIGYLGYRVWEPDARYNQNPDGWTVVVFPTPYEWSGGAGDGGRGVSGFRLDVVPLLDAFTEVRQMAWSSPAQYNGDMDGPELTLTGTFLGKHVLLRVFNLPPPDEPTAFVYDPHKGEVWTRSPRPEEEG